MHDNRTTASTPLIAALAALIGAGVAHAGDPASRARVASWHGEPVRMRHLVLD